jgi:hypothetical protein
LDEYWEELSGMGIDMLNKLVTIVMSVIGTYFIIYHDKLGRETAECRRNKILPFKKATPKEYSISFLIGGIILSLAGILSLLGVIHIKGPF